MTLGSGIDKHTTWVNLMRNSHTPKRTLMLLKKVDNLKGDEMKNYMKKIRINFYH